MTKSPSSTALPRLIRPEKDGQQGGWSYLFHAAGKDYIFPAIVGELGQLLSIFDEDGDHEVRHAEIEKAKEESSAFSTKVIYWKASEWESKLLPFAVEWLRRHQFTFPATPFPVMELRMIEDRDGDDRVTDVLNITAIDQQHLPDAEESTLIIHQYKAVEGEEGKGRRPHMQWWMEGVIRFKGRELTASGWSVPRAAATMAETWGQYPEFTNRLIEERGAAHMFKLFSLHGSRRPEPTPDELRAITIWVAFCRYIASLKTIYEEGLPARGRRRSPARTTNEALALEQATLFKSVGVLKSGVRRKPVATGTGTKHRYRYLVRGHERIINGKVIWIKPQVRGEGEFLNRAVGTEAAVEAADTIQEPAQVNVWVPAQPAEQAKEERVPRRPRPTWLTRIASFFRRFFPLARR